MISIDTGDYTTLQLISFIYEDIDRLSEYIHNTIVSESIYDNSNEFFSDIIKISNYDVNSNPSGDLRKSLRGRHGVYVFALNNNMIISTEETQKYNKNYSGAGFRYCKDYNLKKGQHFYQGSATSQSLLSRINKHYSSYAQESSMKLNCDNRIFMKDKLVLYVFPIKKEFERIEGHKNIIKIIEKKLHERFPAITGSNRV